MQNEPKQDPATPEQNSLNPVARHNARRYALQAMYQWQIAGTPISEIETEFLLNRIDKKTDLAYFKELIHGVPEHQKEIDAEIRPYISRAMSEIDPVELAVIRIATYELISGLIFLIV